MGTELKIIKSNVTLEIGGEERPDLCQVLVNYQIQVPGVNYTTTFGVRVYLLPGSIVKNPLAAKKNAQRQAAALLEKAAKYLRTTEDPQ